jgi:hypothetical protein
MKCSIILAVIAELRAKYDKGRNIASSIKSLQQQWITIWKSFNIQFKVNREESMKAYIAIIEATEKLYKAAMTELIRLLNIFDMGGRGHYIVWNALIARAIVNSCKWSNVDAVSTTASGQAYTYLLELIYDLKTEAISSATVRVVSASILNKAHSTSWLRTRWRCWS